MASGDGQSFTIQSLCPDLLERIFNYLDVEDKKSVAQVCPYWWEVVYQPLLWCGVTADLLTVKWPNDVVLPSLASRRIRLVNAVDEQSLVGTDQHLLNLQMQQSLYLETVSCMPLNRAFTSHYYFLTVLNLVCCRFLVDENLLLIAISAPNLTNLFLGFGTRLTDNALLEITQLKKLTVLKLSFWSRISYRGIFHLCLADFPLVNLELRYCRGLCDGSLSLIGMGMPNLERLDMFGCSTVSGRGLQHFRSGEESKIEYLDLSNCNVQVEAFEYLNGLQQLKELHLRCSKNFYDQSMSKMCLLDNLRTLHLSHCRVGDEGLLILSRGRSKIEDLAILWCGEITDVGCFYLSQLTNLRHLQMTSNGNISDRGVGYICQPNLKLVSLNVSGQRWFNDGSFICAVRMEQLRILKVDKCTGLTNAGLALLTRDDYSSRIVELSLNYCLRITDVGLLRLANLANLKDVSVKGCNVTRVAVHCLTAMGVNVAWDEDH